MYTHFNPGCTLSLYNPTAITRIYSYLKERYPDMQMHETCCHHDPKVSDGALIITACTGCHRRFNTLYAGVHARTIWEVIDEDSTFPLPTHNNLTITVHDPCPARKRPEILASVRSLLTKMQITIVEAENSGDRAICCGNSLYPTLPFTKVREHIHRRAASMPCENVAVYCVTCAKALATGGKHPRYMIDILFNEATDPRPLDFEEWRKAIGTYRDLH
jgi:Fe-S oxidoreductase